jgi:hypothetical protein
MAESQALAACAREALALAEAALAGEASAQVDDATVQRLLTAGIRLFAAKVDLEQRNFLPVRGPDAVTATDAAVTITELLRAVNLNLFDLSMWVGRPRFFRMATYCGKGSGWDRWVRQRASASAACLPVANRDGLCPLGKVRRR